MNKIKEAYKEVIVRFIFENYLELENKIDASQGCMPENVLNEKFSTLKYMKNLIKTITAETEGEIEERIDSLRTEMHEKALRRNKNEK